MLDGASATELGGILSSLAHFWAGRFSTPPMIAAGAFLTLLLLVDLGRRGWQLSWSRRAVTGVIATFAILNLNLIFLPLVWLGAEQVRQVYGLVGVPSIPASFWEGTPVWLMVPFAVLVHDFANYWAHRALHLPLLWPVHAIHHSDPDMNGATALRIHVLEKLVVWVSYTLLLTWLGLPQDAIGIGAVFVLLHTIYVHVNVDWGHGPFRLLLASPRFHRWHHADIPEAHGKNLANICPLWDKAFGTYYCPGRCDAPLGAGDVPQHDVVRLLLWPLQEWARGTRSRINLIFGRLRARHQASLSSDGEAIAPKS